MRGLLRRSLAIVAAAAGLAYAQVSPAAAAPVFTMIGQTAPGTYMGGCLPCSAVQRTSSPDGLYIPHSGVITRFSTRKGSTITTSPQEWIRARTFRDGGATQTTIVSHSAQAILDPATPSTTQTYWDRFPATAGDLLGGQFNTGVNINQTPHVYTAGTTAGDSAASTISGEPDPGVGGIALATPFTSRRVNISARLERDDDDDGYGDGSQDLCLGDAAHATTACSGTLFASNLQGAYKTGGFTCGYACVRVQLTSGGVSTSPAADGVVVRWRMQAPKPGDYHVVILEPAPGGGYTFARTSDTVTGSNPPADFVSFAGSAKSLRVSKAGRFSYAFTATPLRPGTVGLKSTKKVKIGSKKRVMTIAAKSFSAPSAGKVKLKFKLSSKHLKALKKVRKLRFAVTAKLGGKTFTAKLTLKAPKKR